MSILNHPLEFERELVDLEKELEELKKEIAGGNLDLRDQYDKLEGRIQSKKTELYGKLTPYQKVQLSRHFDRPFSLDLIALIFTDFVELHGDRMFRDDPAIVGGTAQFDGQPVMVVGHQRGRSTSERIKRNFGMSQPEGYRKALRLFKLAERFGLPLITLIDTQGAYPGLEAEERGQAEAIARNLVALANLRIPSIGVVIGEGGSGGALALGVTDRLLMFENACYSVITPEGCASILWKAEDPEVMPQRVAQAAESLQLTADGLDKLGIVDDIIPEPLGGAHHSHRDAADSLKVYLHKHLRELRAMDIPEMLEKRYQKYRAMGQFTGE